MLSEDSIVMMMPHNVQVAPNGQSVWVTAVPDRKGPDEQVIVIDQATNTIKKRINIGKDQHISHVVLDSTSRFAYVTCYESNQVIVIDATKLVESTLALAGVHTAFVVPAHNCLLPVWNREVWRL
jgi:DNA-binding beta-propeller fold protein YncE